MVKSIHEAVEIAIHRAGGLTALAAIMGCQKQALHEVTTGKRGLTAHQIARLSAFTGEDAGNLLKLDALNREKDEGKREVMRRVFFSVAAHGALVLSCLITTAHDGQAMPLTQQVRALDGRYIVAAILMKIALMARRVGRLFSQARPRDRNRWALQIAAAGLS